MIGGLLLAATLATGAPAADLQARVEPQEVTVGDRVQVTLELALPPQAAGSAPGLPPGLRQWGDAEVLAVGQPERLPGSDAAPRYRLRVLVAAFRPGEVLLPPLPVVVPLAGAGGERPQEPLRLRTPEGLGFTVRSVLPAEGEPTPQPPTPPQPLPAGARFWWTAGTLAALGTLAAVALALLLRRRRQLALSAPPLPPLTALLRALAELRGESSLERVHTGLSLALRRFLSGAAGVAALERTTSEIERELRRRPLAATTRRALVDLLRRCDEVKFARRPSTVTEAGERLAQARELAEEVDRQLAPPPSTMESAA